MEEMVQGLRRATKKTQEKFTRDLPELTDRQMNKTPEGNRQQDNRGRRMDKWPGGQSSGDHCSRTQRRRKNERRGKRQLNRPLGQHQRHPHSLQGPQEGEREGPGAPGGREGGSRGPGGREGGSRGPRRKRGRVQGPQEGEGEGPGTPGGRGGGGPRTYLKR